MKTAFRNVFFFGLLAFLFLHCSLLQRTQKGGAINPQVKTLPQGKDAPSAPEMGLRRRVLILPFLNLSPYPSEGVAQTAQNHLLDQLHKGSEVIPMDSMDLSEKMDQFQKDDGYDMGQVLPLARKAGAHGVIVGRILEIKTQKTGDAVGVFRKLKAQAKALVSIEMHSTKTGNSILKETRSASVKESFNRIGKSPLQDRKIRHDPRLIRAVIKEAFSTMDLKVVKALGKMDWSGRIALIRGDKLYINAGQITGLKLGDILRVTEAKEEVFDPETGQFLGHITGRLKGTVEVVGYFGKDGAVTVVHSGSGFASNDIVEFY